MNFFHQLLKKKRFSMPEFAHFPIIVNSDVLKKNGRHESLIAKAVHIHDLGGINWFKKYATSKNLENYIFSENSNGLLKFANNNVYRSRAVNAAMTEIANAKRLVTIEKKAHNRKRDMVENLKNLPPIRTSTGRLVYPGGKRSRNSLRRVEQMTDSPLPENLTRMWTSLNLGNASTQSKKRRAPSSTSLQSKRSK
jgi:hypothetical protein